MDVPPQLQSDHLLLLVGSNPLPNAVAACLLLAPGGTAYLLHSPASAGVADNLHTWLKEKRGIDARKVEPPIDEANPASVVAVTAAWVSNYKDSGRIGLHYTGGTKVMAVHASRAIRRALASAGSPSPVCSYLDPSALALYIDAADPTSGGHDMPIAVGHTIHLTVDDVLRLHEDDWMPDRKKSTDLQVALREALRAVQPRLLPHASYIGVTLQGPGQAGFDALAVRGYQLFAFVCSKPPGEGGEPKKAELKLDLFRCYEQARRIGGDEARAALICRCQDDPAGRTGPDAIEREMSSDFDLAPTKPGYREPVKVFGATHLSDLSGAIGAWMRQETSP